MRYLCRRAIDVDPAHIDLGTLWLAFGKIQNTLAVGRPARSGTFDEESMVRSVAIHDPEFRLPLVIDLIDMLTRIHNVSAIRRNLCIVDALEIQIVIGGETCGCA